MGDFRPYASIAFADGSVAAQPGPFKRWFVHRGPGGATTTRDKRIRSDASCFVRTQNRWVAVWFPTPQSRLDIDPAVDA